MYVCNRLNLIMNEFRIKLGSLSNGTNSFLFKINKTFFEEFPLSEVKNTSILAKAIIKKENKNFKLKLVLEGFIYNMLCDICAEDLTLEFKATTNAIIQNNTKELDDDHVIIKTNENSIDLKQIIFESIILNLPKKIQHKKNKYGKLACKQEMLDLISKYRPTGVMHSDERWNELKKLKLK